MKLMLSMSFYIFMIFSFEWSESGNKYYTKNEIMITRYIFVLENSRFCVISFFLDKRHPLY